MFDTLFLWANDMVRIHWLAVTLFHMRYWHINCLLLSRTLNIFILRHLCSAYKYMNIIQIIYYQELISAYGLSSLSFKYDRHLLMCFTLNTRMNSQVFERIKLDYQVLIFRK